MEESTSKNLTIKQLEKLNRDYKQHLQEQEDNFADLDSDSSTSDNDDSNIDKQKITFKAVDRHSPKKETTMLYMFKKYEQLQNECNLYKNKLYKMRMHINKEEQTQHYKNLEFSNILVDKQRLEEEVKHKRYISIKYYISLTFNILTCTSFIILYYSNSTNTYV